MKSYTDLEQSRKLAEILPIESADMKWMYWKSEIDAPKVPTFGYGKFAAECYNNNTEGVYLPCWSIAALMSVFQKEEGSCVSLSFGYYDIEDKYISSWLCCYEKEGDSTDDYIIETIPADNPIDCCYEMILKLKDRNIL